MKLRCATCRDTTGDLFRRKRADKLQRQLDPTAKILVGRHAGASDKYETFQRLSGKIHRPGAWTGERLSLALFPDAEHVTVFLNPAEHVAVHQKAEAAEHSFLGDPGDRCQCAAYRFCQG